MSKSSQRLPPPSPRRKRRRNRHRPPSRPRAVATGSAWLRSWDWPLPSRNPSPNPKRRRLQNQPPRTTPPPQLAPQSIGQLPLPVRPRQSSRQTRRPMRPAAKRRSATRRSRPPAILRLPSMLGNRSPTRTRQFQVPPSVPRHQPATAIRVAVPAIVEGAMDEAVAAAGIARPQAPPAQRHRLVLRWRKTKTLRDRKRAIPLPR